MPIHTEKFRRLFTAKAIPGWMLTAWAVVGFAGNVQFLATSWQWVAAHMNPSDPWVQPVLFVAGVLWLTWAVWDRGAPSPSPEATATSLPASGLTKWPKPYGPELIAGREFMNERVELDGKAYRHCTFKNVTFVYNGTTPASVDNCQMQGAISFDTANDAVFGAIGLCKVFAPLGILTPEGACRALR